MNRPRSPIEMMVDRACGLDPDAALPAPKPLPVTLECAACKKTKGTLRSKDWPEGTARIVFNCPDCKDYGEDARYFDAENNELTFE